VAAGINGVVAKRSIGRYRSGSAWVQVKGERMVLGHSTHFRGWRFHRETRPCTVD
jgi:hypothetical protein